MQSKPPRVGRPRRTPQRIFLEDVVLQHRSDECLLWPFWRDPKGYARIGGDLVHILVCTLSRGEPKAGEEVRHTCGKGLFGCVAPNHVVWGSSLENSADMLAHGTRQRGEAHHSHRLTEDQVRAIRNSNAPIASTADRFGISQATVSSIRTRKRWGWLA